MLQRFPVDHIASALRQVELSIVARGAELKYSDFAAQNMGGALLSLGLYGMAVYLIAMIAWDQTQAVLDAGKTSLGEALRWR